MLHNLKDGQVYVSVDDVHKYLKNTGNMITKETIQGTKCSLEYEKVKHGAKNNRNGAVKAKIYYKLVDNGALQTKQTIPIIHNTYTYIPHYALALQEKRRMKKKLKGKRGEHNKRKRRILQTPLSGKNEKPANKERLIANKMALLQCLYVANNGAAPLLLPKTANIYLWSYPVAQYSLYNNKIKIITYYYSFNSFNVSNSIHNV